MAGKRPIGGGGVAPQATAETEKKTTLPPAPDFSALWGSKESEPAISPEQTSDMKIGGESPALRTERESLPEDTFVEESKSRKFVAGNTARSMSGYLKGKRFPLKTQAIVRHADLSDISGQLGNKIEELRRQVPAVKNGEVHPIYDLLHNTLTLADHHIAQAALEHERGHYGVDYLDKHSGMVDKPVDGMGISEIRKAGSSAAANLAEEVGNTSKETELYNKLTTKGSIGHTRRAADLLKEVTSHLTKISVDGASQAKVDKRLTAPELFDTDGDVQNKISSTLHDYANMVDIAHKAENPERPEPAGRALSASAAKDLQRINSPDVLSGLGERGLASRKLADIKSMFDRRNQGRKSLADALAHHAGLERKMADDTFERIYGEKLLANQAYSKTANDVISKARAAVTTAQTRITPQGPSSRLDLSRASGVLPSSFIRAPGASSDESAELMRRANSALQEANSSGDMETANRLQNHLETITHHEKLATANSGSGGAIVKEGVSTTPLGLPSGAAGAKELKDWADIGKFDVQLQRTMPRPQSVESSAPFMAAKPGEATTELTASADQKVKHPYYEKPVIDRLTGSVREGKNDEAIAAIQAQIRPLKDNVAISRLNAQLQPLYAEHRQAKANLLEKEQNGVRNKSYVGKKALDRADQEYAAASSSVNQAPASVQALKSALVVHHTSEAGNAREALRQTLVGLGKVPTTPRNLREIAPDLAPIVDAPSQLTGTPYPEVPTREQFYSAVGVGRDEFTPNLRMLKTTTGKNKGQPLTVKQAKGRGAIFSDASGRQYASGLSLPKTEEEASGMIESAKAAAAADAKRQKDLQSSIDTGLTAQGKIIYERGEADRQKRIETARRIGLDENYTPIISSDFPAIRGILPLGQSGSKPIVSTSGKSAIVPGIGVVPIPPRKKGKKGRRKITAESLMGPEAVGKSEFVPEPMLPLNLRNMSGIGAASTTLEEPDLAQSDEARARVESDVKTLGRQFRTIEPA